MSRAKARSLPVMPDPVKPEPANDAPRGWIVPEWLIATGVAIVIFGGLVALFMMATFVWIPQQRAHNVRAMSTQVGIVNDHELPLVIANSMSSSESVNGALVLFVGSITSQTQDTIRIGYKAPNGDSYILSVPVKYVVFHQEVGVTPGGTFHFNDWDVNMTVQDNIDAQFGYASDSRITVNLTPQQFQKLVQG